MNCIQAQVLLTTHRELKNSEVDITELEAHLEQCASCRQVLADNSFIGEQVRLLPLVEPPLTMHTKLMRALAAEHIQFIQHSAVGTPAPEFLKPYLQEHAHSSPQTDSLTAFSTADTGPLPIIRAPYRKRRRSSMGQFAIIGLAAMFFLTLMMGGITSLLLLAHDHVSGGSGSTSINHPIDVVSAAYATNTLYTHVVSAVGDSTSVYYTAHGDATNSSWMVERLDRATKISTPLLTKASTSPLILLGSASGWVVWLQLDAPRLSTQALPHHELHSYLQTWSLHALSLIAQQQNDLTVPNEPLTLVSSTFNQAAAPDWVHSPVQGIWFGQNTLLVTLIDKNGSSHIMSYPLDMKSFSMPTEIAKASPGHVFTSPTANSDSSQIYWADQWYTNDDTLHSNIWTQQVFENPHSTRGPRAPETITEKHVFIQDGMSFRPVVVDESLFLLSTADVTSLTRAPGTKPKATLTATPAVAAASNSTTPAISWADTNYYSAPVDNEVRGTLLMFPLAGIPDPSPTLVSTIGTASSLQAGTDFVLWQNDDNSYGMYDAATKTNITVGDVLNGAQFLAVNGDTAVWTVNTTQATTTTAGAGPLATLMTFNWPRK